MSAAPSTNPPIPRNRFFLISCTSIFLGWGIIQTFLLFWYGISMNLAIRDSLVSAASITVACYVVGNALHYYQPGKEKTIYILVWVISLSLICMASIRYSVAWIVPDAEHNAFVTYSLPLRFIAASLLIGWIAIINVLWNISQNYREYEQRKTDAEKMAREAELYNLRQQLQPHFLFNSLNSIIALITKKPQEARKMVFQLSDFLRGTLHKDDQKLLDISDELEHLQLYLDIEKVRFGHRLNVKLEVDDNTAKAQLPAMIVQPLLENAIKYGLYDTTEQVNIEIKVTRINNLLVIRIQNPFDAENIRKQKSSGFGLRSVERRLFLLYGRTDLLQTHSEDNLFTSTISIPQ